MSDPLDESDFLSSDADPVNLVLIEPGREGRSALEHVLAGHPDLQVLARISKAAEVLHKLREIPRHSGVTALVALHQPDGQDALGMILTIRQYFPAFRILGFGTRLGQLEIENAFFAGADGYL